MLKAGLHPKSAPRACVETIEYTSFASSSAGNAGVVSFGDTHILLDAGIPATRITEGLASIGLRPGDLAALLVTHGHSDHVKGLPVFRKRCDAPLYMADGGFVHERPFTVGDISIYPFATPHDAPGSTGFRFEADGTALGFATDLGFLPRRIAETLAGCSLVVLEANYDPDMLESGSYPYHLKRRIASSHGHLCNEECAEGASYLKRKGARRIALAHLSKENNTPERAFRTVADRLGSGEGLLVLPRDAAMCVRL